MDGFSFKFYQGKPFLDVKSSRTNHGFITETPLNIILEQKMSSDKNNPSINYKKNLKNTIRFSKRFHASTINRTENEISSLDENRSSLKFFDGKQNDEIESNNFDIKQKIKKSNVLSNLNPFFLTKTQEINSQTYNYSPQKKLLNYKKTKRPETDFKKNILKRLYLNKNSLSDLIKLRFPITTDNAKRKIEEKLFRRSGINSIVVDGETPSINKEKDLQNKFPSSSPKENESQQMLKLDLNLERTFTNIEENNSPLVSSPLLMTFAEEFKDLTKLELRKKLFRKYSLKKKEKRPIIQNPILEEENFRKTNGETIDFENFINKRKEFEVYYEDELFKTGYFNETNNTDFLDLKQEKKSGLIQRNINGTKKGLPNNKEEIVKGTHKLYEKYFREKDIKENNNSPSHKIQNNESFLRGFNFSYYIHI